MDVSPSLSIDDPAFDIKDIDLTYFEFGINSDFSSLGDFDDPRPISNNGINNNTLNNNNNIINNNIGNNNHLTGDLGTQSWTYHNYHDVLPKTQIASLYKESENSSDKMWGGGYGGGLPPDNGKGVFYNTFCKSEPIEQPMESKLDVPHLFSTLVSEKPIDTMSSHNHRSPGSDSVSGISASASSDSGISTSPHDNASFAHLEQIFYVDSMADTAAYSMDPGDATTIDHGYTQSYITPTTDETPILEGVLRGTVRRNGNFHSMQKTLTEMSNAVPLPPFNTVLKTDNLVLPPSQPQISSTNGMYASYDYVTHPADEYSPVDSAVKISPAASTTTNPQESKVRKRKYTKRGTADEASSKGRLLHFCNVCQKGFKDKYSVNVHHRTHTGEKPFECTQCGKCFRQKAHLAKHVQIHNSAHKPPGKR